ncbi:hypothetical protein DRW07_01905 [Alteromonas sediminis]|uniref:Porin n=1 Tax=Alteromonas sediminis TaxID=2259342 RepID=A0A3N5Y2N6_9ALTE|nr:porin [Alteromonas sediminis]RPJ68187.1 hypothetical protein DRW07_01905 [Alteromonas sediminis]
MGIFLPFKVGLNAVFFCLLFAFQSIAFAQSDISWHAYGSLRLGLEHIDADIKGDGWYWRDYLSRVGIKPEWKIDEDLSFTGHVEYGLKGQLLDELHNTDALKKRLSYLGILYKHHSLFYGRQNVVWHQFVRTNYFLGGLDTERQGVLRDDNLLQYFYHNKNSRMGMGIRFDETQTLGLRNVQLGGQTSYQNLKLQVAIIRDQFGSHQGTLVGAKLWYYLDKNWTLSVYAHNASSNFDEYAGSSSGVVKIHQAEPATLINAIRTCAQERRTSYGVYGGYQWQAHKIHGRAAADKCKTSGEVDSLRVEYIYSIRSDIRLWLSIERLNYLAQMRSPLAEVDDVYHSQLGVRYDF